MRRGMSIPQEIRPLIAFASALRAQGFAVAPDQTIGFVEAVGLLGPSSIDDIHDAGLALFAIAPDRRDLYDSIFRAVFYGLSLAAPVPGDDSDTTDAHDTAFGEQQAETGTDTLAPGRESSDLDIAKTRAVDPDPDNECLRYFARMAPSRLPRKGVLRRRAAKKGERLHLRQSMRQAVRYDGDFHVLLKSRQKVRHRRILFLIDVSGSMRDHSAAALNFAHRLVLLADHAEVFSLATRLTRLTPLLRTRVADFAVGRAASAIGDFDGGTRLGDTLGAFLSVPRFAGLARGAWTVIYSDGLERDAPDTLAWAAQRLDLLCWRLSWLTPLGGAGRFQPQTEGLKKILPFLDDMNGAPDLRSLADFFLSRPDSGTPFLPANTHNKKTNQNAN